MSGQGFDYNQLVENALKGVMRTVLTEVAEHGLQGDTHFYISFQTGTDGVKLSKHLAERYPEEMMIVVQKRFWGLKVFDDHFEIGLSFDQKPEELVIPYEYVTGFVDPSVQFALQWKSEPGESEGEDGGDVGPTTPLHPVSDLDDILTTAMPDFGKPPAKQPKSKKSDKASGNVVTLDAFRKET